MASDADSSVVRPDGPAPVARPVGRRSGPPERLSPIFIAGCDRSGTTLLGALLGASPEIVCLPESHFIGENATGRPFGPEQRLALLRRFGDHYRYAAWRQAGCPEPDRARVGGATYADLVSAVVGLYASAIGKPGIRRFVDHSPPNVLWIRALAEGFPDARFVHIVRDGRAVAASLMPLDWGPNDILEAADHWALRVGAGLAAERWLGPERFMTLHFEDLLADPDRTLAAVNRFLGCKIEAAGYSPESFRVPAYSQGIHRLVGQPLDASRIDSWAGSLSRRQVELFEAAAGHFLDYLGYPRRCEGGAPRRASRTERLVMYATRPLKKASNSIRYRRRHRQALAAAHDDPPGRAPG